MENETEKRFLKKYACYVVSAIYKFESYLKIKFRCQIGLKYIIFLINSKKIKLCNILKLTVTDNKFYTRK